MGNKNEHINLDKIGRDYPFRAPDGYFDQFPEKMMARIEAENKPQKNLFFIRYLKPALGLVASFLIIMGLLYIPVKLIFPVKTDQNQSALIITDEEYLISYPLSDHAIFESLEGSITDDVFDNDQLETVLLASVSEYELIDLTN
jgi:hypothetical protein